MSGRWTHPICERCWDEREPDREPTKVIEPDTERCCFCGAETSEGIYIREDPETLQCQGNHEGETE